MKVGWLFQESKPEKAQTNRATSHIQRCLAVSGRRIRVWFESMELCCRAKRQANAMGYFATVSIAQHSRFIIMLEMKMERKKRCVYW